MNTTHLTILHLSPSQCIKNNHRNQKHLSAKRRHLAPSSFLSKPNPFLQLQSSSMDDLLCDELLEYIFHRLPPPPTAAVSLVSKRWLRVSRSSTTCLTLRLFNSFTASSFVSFLSAYPFLDSLSVVSPPDAAFHCSIIAALGDVSCPVNLTQLRLFTPPLSPASVGLISRVCGVNLVCLSISVSPSFDFTCLTCFASLKELSVSFVGESGVDGVGISAEEVVELPLESLSLSGVGYYGINMDWLWRSCRRLRVLRLKCCQGVGALFGSLDGCFSGLERVELRTCRTIVDKVLFKLSEVSRNIESLLVYDGGSREGLLHFIKTCKSDLRRVDFRLPLDFDDDHLYALGQSFKGLTSLTLQSCCLVTGQGLKSLAAATCDGLRELSLVSCDVVEREPGLLAALGQSLKMLTTLDLSYNETLQDKELVSMLGSCSYLNKIKLRGCRRLTNASFVSLSRSCKHLKTVDIAHCWKLEPEFVEMFILSSPTLRRIVVEEGKITDVARSWMLRKSIDHIFA